MNNHYKLGYTDQLNEVPPTNIPVSGKLPPWLSGTLVRNGPGRWDAKTGGKSFNHWFDGMSMLHGFTFEDGNVSYQNKFLRSPAYDKAMKAGTLQTREFATDPCWNIFQKFFL